MIFSLRPPIVSRPTDSGHTSSSSQSPARRLPARTSAWIAAAERDDLVRVEVGQRRPPEQRRDRAPHRRHPRRAADEHDAVDGGRRDAGGRASALRVRAQRALDERRGQRVERRP